MFGTCKSNYSHTLSTDSAELLLSVIKDNSVNVKFIILMKQNLQTNGK